MVQEHPTAEGHTSKSTDHVGMTRSGIIPVVLSNEDLAVKSAKSKVSKVSSNKIDDNKSKPIFRSSLS